MASLFIRLQAKWIAKLVSNVWVNFEINVMHQRLIRMIACLFFLLPTFGFAQPSDSRVPNNIEDKLDKMFVPPTAQGLEWVCRTTKEFTCSAAECKTSQTIDTYFEIELSESKYRFCSKGGFILGDAKGECLAWNRVEHFQSGAFYLLSPVSSEGYLKIENANLEFIAVSPVAGLTNRSSFGKCKLK